MDKEIQKGIDYKAKETVELLFTIDNPLRTAILIFLKHNPKGASITEIQTEVELMTKQQYSYKNFHKHVKLLEKTGLVTTEKQTRKKHQPRIVKINKEKLPITLKVGNEKYPIL